MTAPKCRQANPHFAAGGFKRRCFHDVHVKVSGAFGVRPEDLFAKRSTRRLAFPRFALVFWLRAVCKEGMRNAAGEIPPISFPSIARRLGWFDHSTAMHAFERANKLWLTDPAFGTIMDDLQQEFLGANDVG